MWQISGRKFNNIRYGKKPDAVIQPVNVEQQVHKNTGILDNDTATAQLRTAQQPMDEPHVNKGRRQVIQYEQWLQQQVISFVDKHNYYETEITKHRKQKKSLKSKQSTMRKNGR